MNFDKIKSNVLSPLGIISLFISLTEVVTGIAVTQATGGIQIALTVFVISFPMLIAIIFFVILWKKPYVFYPPDSYSSNTDVQNYVKAMQSGEKLVKANIEAEVDNLRNETKIEFASHSNKLLNIEALLGSMSKHIKDSKSTYQDFKKSIDEISDREKILRIQFNQNSEIKVHVMTVTIDAPTNDEYKIVEDIADKLKEIGFKTVKGGHGSSGEFEFLKNTSEYNKIRIFHSVGLEIKAKEIETIINKISTTPTELISRTKKSNWDEINKFGKRYLKGSIESHYDYDIVIAKFIS